MADEIKKSVIIDLKFDVSDFTQSAMKLNKEISDLDKKQKELKKSSLEGSVEYQKNSEVLKTNRRELAETNKVIENLTIANKANTGSNEQLKAQLSILTLEYNKLSEAERNNSARGKELFGQINQTTTTLKENEKAVGNNTRNVGNYEGALKNAGSGLQQFGGAAGQAANGVSALGTKLLTLLANPIVLIVAGIVGAFMALKKAFMSSEEGQDKLAKVTQIFSTVLSKLFDIIKPLANFLFDVVVKVFNDVAKAASLAIDIVEKGLRVLGFEDAAKGVANYTAELKGAAKAGAAIAEARDKADEKERVAIVANAKANAEIAEARRIAQDKENFSRSEREAAIKRAVKLEDEVAGRQEAIAQLRFKALKVEQTQASATEEAKKELAEAEAKLFNIQQERSEGQKTLLRDLNKLAREENAEAKERQKEQQAALEKKKADEKKAEADRLKDLADYYAKEADLAIQAAEFELNNIIRNNQMKIDNNQFLSDELYKQEISRLNLIAEAQRNAEIVKFEQGKISLAELNEALNQINFENDLTKAELNVAKKEAEKEQQAIDLANQYEIDLQNNENAFALQNQELERSYQAEITAAEKTGANKKLIEEKYKKYKDNLDLQQSQTSLQVAGDTFGALASLMSDNADAAKAFASFQAVMNATNSIISVLAATSTIPEPFGSVAKGIQAAAIGVTAFKNVQKINSTPVPKAEKGMILGGKSHRNGGVQISADGVPILEAEKGELLAIVNQRNTSMLNYLSDLNSFGGNGNSFFARGGTKTFANGGIGFGNVSTSVEQSQNSIEQFMAAIQNLPTPVVAVQDINEVQYSTNQVQVRANL